MCHILCFLTGAGLATYLARRRHDPLYDDEEDVYYGDRMRERERNAATGNPDAGNVRGIEQVDRKQQQEQDLQQEARGTGERGRFHRSLSKVTRPLVEFFQNVGDALDETAHERQARHTTAATTTAQAPQPQPQPMAEKSPLPETGEKGERAYTPRT
ncbi:hypothetical protein CCMSSC00406_0006849 [Pleurotus cornucopiae]|uniref:Uncharacterized protein n=1 Tax=Pleurotus cornucopiae TaxID=5321 RepID=A0ACB7J4M5_PLECO|nr:hypothetical protein CCMSSC00406_0006849 [Pleurotus cornucopiae]